MILNLQTKALAQNDAVPDCIVPSTQPIGISLKGPNNGGTMCPLINLNQTDYHQQAIVTVYVAFHFVERPDGANFNCDAIGPNDFNFYNAPTVTAKLIDRINEKLAAISAYTWSSDDEIGVPDARIRFQLFDPNPTENNVCDGIYLWENEGSIQYPLGSTLSGQVLNVLFTCVPWTETDDTDIGISGSTGIGASVITERNLLNNMAAYGGPIPGRIDLYATSIIHEFGHIMGLSHAFACASAGNLCAEKSKLECNNYPQVTPSVCADCFGCNAYSPTPTTPIPPCHKPTVSNNFMSYRDSEFGRSSFSPCQWEVMYDNILNVHNPDWMAFANNCTEFEPDLILSDGGDVVWSIPKFLNRDVYVESGTTLRITCDVKMSDRNKIVVRQGARVIIDGGHLTSLCEDVQWQGIIVEGNNNKTHTSDMLNENYVMASNDPGIVIVNANSIIENARNAISCNAGQGKWNGLVVAEKAIFRNNRRSIELMYDDKPNGTQNTCKSSIKTCEFLNEDGSAQQGITNWGADEVVIKGCTFKGLSDRAILTWDADETITECNFDDNSYGVYCVATAPMQYDMSINYNTFKENTNGIYSGGVDNLEVANNTFDGHFVGYYAVGETSAHIHDNSFNGGFAAVGNVQTGTGLVQYNCNLYNHPGYGMYVLGSSQNARIEHETFATAASDIWLANRNSDSGKLPAFGNAGDASYNLFTDGTQNHIRTQGNTIGFKYYHPNPANNPLPDPIQHRVKPLCSSNENIGCTLANNFETAETDGGIIGCLDGLIGGGGSENFTQTYLDSLYTHIADIEARIGSTGGTSAEQAELEALKQQKNFVLNTLITEALHHDKYNTIEALLIAEGTSAAERRRYGLKVRMANYTAADAILQSLPRGSTDEQFFYLTQTLNLRRLIQGNTALTASDIQTLTNIGNSDYPSATYAQAIVMLLTDRVYEPILPDVPNSNNGNQLRKPAEEKLRVYPNPGRDFVTVTIPADIPTVTTRLHLYNAMGVELAQHALTDDGQVTLNTASLPEGLYFVSLVNQGRVYRTATFSLQR